MQRPDQPGDAAREVVEVYVMNDGIYEGSQSSCEGCIVLEVSRAVNGEAQIAPGDRQ